MSPNAKLNAFLRAHNSDSAQYSIEALRDEASNRKYYLIEYKNESAVLCMDTPFLAEHSDFLVVQDQLLQNNIPVPNIFSMSAEDGWILQEFCGSDDLSDIAFAADSSVRLNFLTECLTIIRSMQSIPLRPPVAKRFFDSEKLLWEMEFLEEWLKQLCNSKNVEFYFTFELKMFLAEVSASVGSFKPNVFCHRDFHSRNILYNDGRLTVIDFQDARTGSIYYDLASLLYDPYMNWTVQERLHAMDIFENSANWNTNDFYLQSLQRLLKAIGSYCFLIEGKKRTDYISPLKQGILLLPEIIEHGKFPDSVYLFQRHLEKELLPTLDSFA